MKSIKKGLLLIAVTALAACGGGSSGGGGAGSSLDSVQGSVIDGPMANATVKAYKFESGGKGVLLATGATDSKGAITGLSLKAEDAPFILEAEADGDTIDISTGVAPTVKKVKTILTATQLANMASKPVYATPLTSVATDIALSKAKSTTTPEELEKMASDAARQTVAALGFGLADTVDIFTQPPVITATSSSSDINDTAAYRAAIEALVDVVEKAGANSGSVDATQVLEALGNDLSDGAIDGKKDGVAITELNGTQVASEVTATPTIDEAAIIALLEGDAAATGTGNDEVMTDGSINDGTVSITVSGGDTTPDTDQDGFDDADDNCPVDANAGQEDLDGDGVGDVCDDDDDGDSVEDTADNCPLMANPGQEDQDGDGVGNVCDDDLDGDTVANASDNCPLIANENQTDTDGDGTGDACDSDDDDDTVADTEDNCPLIANAGQEDLDGDGIGDACDDDKDGDGVDNATDNCPLNSNEDQVDTDGDGAGNACDDDMDGDTVLNASDNCPLISNPGQEDADGDGVGDACDTDDDNDGVDNDVDNCPAVSNADQTDTDGDGAGDACDNDDDGDGVADGADNCPLTSNAGQEDLDSDGTGDACDDDRDGDGTPNAEDTCPDDATDSCTPPEGGTWDQSTWDDATWQ